MSAPRKVRRDPRGTVAIVRATEDGPRVTFPYGSQTVALRSALAVWGEHDGHGHYPCTFFVQERGQWVPA